MRMVCLLQIKQMFAMTDVKEKRIWLWCFNFDQSDVYDDDNETAIYDVNDDDQFAINDDDVEIRTILAATLTQMLAKTEVKEKGEENPDHAVLNWVFPQIFQFCWIFQIFWICQIFQIFVNKEEENSDQSVFSSNISHYQSLAYKDQ